MGVSAVNALASEPATQRVELPTLWGPSGPAVPAPSQPAEAPPLIALQTDKVDRARWLLEIIRANGFGEELVAAVPQAAQHTLKGSLHRGFTFAMGLVSDQITPHPHRQPILLGVTMHCVDKMNRIVATATETPTVPPAASFYRWVSAYSSALDGLCVAARLKQWNDARAALHQAADPILRTWEVPTSDEASRTAPPAA